MRTALLVPVLVSLVAVSVLQAGGTVLAVVRQGNTVTFATNSNESAQGADRSWKKVGDTCKVLSNGNVFVLQAGMVGVRSSSGLVIGDIPRAIEESLQSTSTLHKNEGQILSAIEVQYQTILKEIWKQLTPQQKQESLKGSDNMEGQRVLLIRLGPTGIPEFDMFGVDVSIVGAKLLIRPRHWDLREFEGGDVAITMSQDTFYLHPWSHSSTKATDYLSKYISELATSNPALYGGKAVMGELTYGKQVKWIMNGDVCSHPSSLSGHPSHSKSPTSAKTQPAKTGTH
jgi:hypothetical protein